jgi:PAS domain S-box-containing protein
VTTYRDVTQRRRGEEALRRRVAEATALLDVARAVSASLDLQAVLDLIVDRAGRLLGTERAALAIVEPAPREALLRFVALRGLTAGFPREMRPRHWRDGTTPTAIAERHPAWSADILADPAFDLSPQVRDAVLAEGYRAVLSVPLLVGDRVLGALSVYRDTPGPFGQDQIDLLQGLAAQGAVAIENARLFEDAERRRREAEVLADLSRHIGASLDLDTTLQRVTEGARHLCASDMARIALRELASGTVVFRYGTGVRHRETASFPVEPGRGVAGLVLTTGQPFRTDAYGADPRITKEYVALARDEDVVTTMAVPIRIDGRVEGLLHVDNRAPRPFTDRDEAVLLRLAEHAAIAIKNARLFGETERRRRAAESLAALGRVVTPALDPQEVGQRIVDGIRDLLGTLNAALYVADPSSGDLTPLAFSGEMGPGFSRETVLPRGTAAAGLAVRDGRPVVTPDLLADPRIALGPETRARIERSPYRAVLSVPLTVQDRVIGALSVGEPAHRVFGPEEIALGQTFADRAALTLETARLHAEVSRARDFLRSIAESSPDGIVTTDTHGRLTYLSPGAETMFGHRAGEVLGRPAAEFYVGGETTARLVMERLRKEGWLRSHEAAVVAKDGRRFVVDGSFSLLRDAVGRVVGTLGILKDLTERKQAEDALRESEQAREDLEAQLRQAQKMEAVGRLAGGVAHDFNNLLTVIRGRSDLLLHRLGADDPLRRHVLLLQQTSERAAALTQQLLAFSRKQMLQPRVLDLNAVVEGMTTMLRRLIGEHIDLDIRLDPELGTVKADPGQLEQVILNLAVNARDAMPQGGRLGIGTANAALDEAFARRHPGARPGAFVRLQVADTGIGMDAEVLAHLFEPFFTTKTVGQGTGLGLATVYGIVKQSGGYIQVDSAPGRGATFAIYLPRVADTGEAREGRGPGAPSARGSETILLVEDEDAVRELGREILEMHGYTVLEAPHGAQALVVSDRHAGPIHLMVTDVVMPHMSGRELVERVAPERPDMRILYVSGYTDDAVIREGMLQPGSPFLQKPFTPDALARRVREVLDAPRPA